MPSSRAPRTRGMPPDGVGGRTTTSPSTKAITRACSTPTSRRSATRSWSRSPAATAGWTWRCAPGGTFIYSSSKWWSWPLRARRWRSYGRARLRGQVSRTGRADPSDRRGAQPRDAQCYRVRGSRRLTPRRRSVPPHRLAQSPALPPPRRSYAVVRLRNRGDPQILGAESRTRARGFDPCRHGERRALSRHEHFFHHDRAAP